MLHKQTKQLHQQDNYWSNLYFTAEEQQEQFADVHVITTKADYADRLLDQLSFQVRNRTIPQPRSHNKIIERLLNIHNTRMIETCERVDIHNGQIKVVINVDEINEQTTFKALRYVADALSKLNGKDGTITFSSYFTYETHELFWLFTH